MKFDLEQALLFGFLVNIALGLFAAKLGTLACSLSRLVLTQHQPPQPPAGNSYTILQSQLAADRDILTTETNTGIKKHETLSKMTTFLRPSGISLGNLYES